MYRLVTFYSLFLLLCLCPTYKALGEDSDTSINQQTLLLDQMIQALNQIDIDQIQQLIIQGVNPNIQTRNGYTAMHVVALTGNTEVIDILLKKGAKPDIQASFGVTALHIAARYGETEVLRQLVEAGAKIDIGDERRQTPLHTAIFYNKTYTAANLLEMGAKIEAKDIKQRTPFLIAAKRNHPDMLQQLAQSGAKINAVDELNRSALHLAIIGRKLFPDSQDRNKTVELLVDMGLPISQADAHGKTPIDYAQKSDIFIKKILRNNRALQL